MDRATDFFNLTTATQKVDTFTSQRFLLFKLLYSSAYHRFLNSCTVPYDRRVEVARLYESHLWHELNCQSQI